MLQTKERTPDQSSPENSNEEMSVLDETLMNLRETAKDSDDKGLESLVDTLEREVNVMKTELTEHKEALDYVSKNPHVLTAGGEHEIAAGNPDGEPVKAHEVSGEAPMVDPNEEFIQKIGWEDERRPDGVAPQHEYDEFMNGENK